MGLAEDKFFNGIPDDLQHNLAMIDELGGPKTYNHYCNGWAMAFNPPFKMWKRYEFNGGTADPCIISWPSVLSHGGELRHQYHHAIDVVPTILDLLSVTPPEMIKGYVQSRFDGVSMRYSFGDPSASSARPTQFYSMLGSRGIWHDGWKAVTNHPTIAGWSHFNDDVWELYHTDTDRSEVHDLAAQRPDKLRELINLWFAEAGPMAPSRSMTGPRWRSSARPGRSRPARATGTSTTSSGSPARRWTRPKTCRPART